MKSSKEYYDSIAKDYANISDERSRFLQSVNNLIISGCPRNCDYADVGAGDGHRSLIIADGIKAATCTLIDESSELLGSIPSSFKPKIINSSILDLDLLEQFDVVTCLWNVLGHIGDRDQRNSGIRNIAKMTRPGGLAFIDVNNRYNIEEYGIENVMRNIESDRSSTHDRGWFPISQSDSSTKVYIHDPFELDEQFERSGFNISEKYFVDYDSGEIHNVYWKGQVLYKLRKSS